MTHTPALWPHFVKSGLVHGAAVALLVSMVNNQEAKVRAQEKLVMDDVTQKMETEEQQLELEQKEAARETLSEQVQQEVEAAIREQVQDPETLAELAKVTEEAVKAQLDKAEATTAVVELNAAERQALQEQLLADTLDAVKDSLQDVTKDELLAMAQDYVENEAVPDISAKIESELNQRLGDEVRKEMEKKANEVIKPKDGKLTAAAKAEAAKDALAQVREQVKADIAKAVTDTAIPAAANKISKAMADQIKAHGADQAAFTEQLKAAITSALTTGLTGADAPSSEAALNKAKEAFGASDPAAILAAKSSVDQAITAIAAASASQSSVQAQVAAAQNQSGAAQDQATGAAAATQTQAVAAVSAAVAAAGAALSDASAATSQSAGSVAQAQSQLVNSAALGGSETAKANLEHGALKDAGSNLDNSQKALAATKDSLGKVSSDLAKAAAKAAAAASSSTDLAAAMGSAAQADSAVSSLGKAATSTVAQKAGAMVGSAASAVNTKALTDALNQAASHGSLAQLGELAKELALTNADAEARASNAVASLSAGVMQGIAASAASDGQGESAGSGTDGSSDSSSASGNGSGSGASSGRGGGGHSTPGVGGFKSSGLTAQEVRANASTYDAFVKDLRDRLNPNNFYGEGGTALGARAKAESKEVMVAQAHNRTGSRAGTVFIAGTVDPEAQRKKQAARRADPKRQVQDPGFTTIAYACAPMQEKPLRIDGDISDWGKLSNPITMQYGNLSNDKKQGGPTIHMRWASDGLYFTWTITKDPTTIQGNPNNPYSGDCLELYLDTDNARKSDYFDGKYAHHFAFDPFGFKGDMTKTVCEIGYGMRGIPVHTQQWRDDGKAIAKKSATGYTVEAFLPRVALAKRSLVPGDYLAVNFSLHWGTDGSTALWNTNQMHWSASKFIETYKRPDTWGDILLLGADAETDMGGLATQSVAEEGSSTKVPPYIAPGDPISFAVTDRDMNLSPYVPDRVAAAVKIKGGGTGKVIVLEETGDNTGVFRASFDTQSYVMPARADALSVRPGDVVQLTYVDPRGAYGEANVSITHEIEVAFPFVVISQK